MIEFWHDTQYCVKPKKCVHGGWSREAQGIAYAHRLRLKHLNGDVRDGPLTGRGEAAVGLMQAKTEAAAEE